MTTKYFPAEFEKKWVKEWSLNKTYKTTEEKKRIYCLSMFPYPSGAGLHVGHVRIYTGTDVLSRYFRMKGLNVLHPMGWDAFGLPAENAAIKAKKNPMDMVPENIATFKRQMQTLGLGYDWDREFATTDPQYYKWTQWLFIQFFRMGLLYKKNTPINFCPSCKTGLAEEEVLSDGTHERCGNKIIKKDLPQWIFKITAYADRLLKDLEGLDWPDGILEMQRNWIGKKEGINITYKVVSVGSEEAKNLSQVNSSSNESVSSNIHSRKFSSSSSQEVIDEITCFTTRPDTNFGVTFIVIAPEHPFVEKIINSKFQVSNKSKISNSKLEEIKNYVKTAKAKTEIEREAEGKKKTGVFTGFYAINQLNGYKMPIWISDFVLSSFGTGAVVGVPGHDVRDFEFAKEFNLEIIRVVVGKDGDKSAITKKEQVQEDTGVMINSEFLNGLDIHEATRKIMNYFEEKGWGKRVVTYHLRDWIFSRQRYWGEPIPMVNCEKCGWLPIDEKDLPVKLPYLKSYEPTDTGESPLSKVTDWVRIKCPNCGGDAKRETDTMPNWAGSCWYFIRFAQNPEKNWLANRSLDEEWLPVDWYLGGAEHAVLHLLYSRFWVKALQDLKLLDFSEPFLRLRNVGMVLAEDHRKMSKSFNNVINPDDVVLEFGADALRLYEMFIAPFNQEIAWSIRTLQGGYRFLKRVWEIYQEFRVQNSEFIIKEDKKLVIKLRKTIYKVTEDIANIKFNTAIAAMMEFLNEWEHCQAPVLTASVTKGLSRQSAKQFLQILAPFAPFITEEIWHTVFGEKESIHLSKWPDVKKEEIADEEIVIPIQINGKLRETIIIQSSESRIQNYVVGQALKSEKIKKYLEGKKYQVIYVPKKIINFILN